MRGSPSPRPSPEGRGRLIASQPEFARLMTQPLNILRIDTRNEQWREAIAALRERLSPRGNVVSEAGRQRTIEVFGEPLSPEQVVERICGDVRERGLPAVLEYSAKIDKAELSAETIRVPAAESGGGPCSGRSRVSGDDPPHPAKHSRFSDRHPAPRRAARSADGGYLRQRYLPLDRVGICVPGGAAAYPSTVLMTAVPAQAAGVKELAIVAPPTKFGAYSPDLLATCHALGIRRSLSPRRRPGGGGAGLRRRGLPQVDKIVGPGNLFVALAKKHVYGEVDIDSIAGPSEVVVVADELGAARLYRRRPDRPGRTFARRECPDFLEREAARSHGGRTGEQTRHARPRRSGAAMPGGIRRLDLGRDAEEAAAWPMRSPRSTCTSPPTTPNELLRKIRNAGAAFLGNYSRWRWAIMWPARRMCCRPAARRGLPADCRPTTFCAARA